MVKRKRSYKSAVRASKRARVGYRRLNWLKRRRYYRRRKKTSGFPKFKTVTLRYVQNRTLDTTAVARTANAHVWRCNSIYDPDYTGVGHQPYAHDTWETIYNKYCVVSSKITVTFIPILDEDSHPGRLGLPCSVGIVLDDNATYSTNPQTLMEISDSCWKSFGLDYNKNIVLTKTYSWRKWNGPMKARLSTDVHNGAAFGANPTDNVYFIVWACNQNTNDVCTFECNVKIDFRVILFDAKEFTES